MVNRTPERIRICQEKLGNALIIKYQRWGQWQPGDFDWVIQTSACPAEDAAGWDEICLWLRQIQPKVCIDWTIRTSQHQFYQVAKQLGAQLVTAQALFVAQANWQAAYWHAINYEAKLAPN